MSEYDENCTPGVKSPADSKHDVRVDVLDPPNQTTFKDFKASGVTHTYIPDSFLPYAIALSMPIQPVIGSDYSGPTFRPSIGVGRH